MLILVIVMVLATHEPMSRLVGVASLSVQQPPSPEAKVISDFMDRIREYLALGQQVERMTPRLPQDATPQQIDRSRRALTPRLQTTRAAAKQGDLFTAEMTSVVRRLLNRVFAGPEGRQLRSSIMDENPVAIPLKVNQLYPDTVPLSTMPPELLKALPELPEELQYRFIGDHLILLDPHAQMIADFIPDALPGK
jgi:hypothetical protein